MARQSTPQEASARPRRTPVAKRNRLEIKNKEPGYFYRIVNDVDDKVSLLAEQGYEIVTDSSITIGDRRVGRASQDGSPVQVAVGGGTDGFLMRIKEEFYQEDQAYKEQRLKELEQSMRKEATDISDYGSLKIK